MDVQEDNNYVTNTEHDLLWNDHEDKRRSSTDMPFLIAFGFFVVLWIGISIHAYTTGVPPPDLINNNEFQKLLIEIKSALNNNIGACFGFVWLAVWLLALYFIMIRWVTKITIYITIVLYCVSILAGFIFIFGARVKVLFIPLLFSSIGYVIVLYALKRVGTETVYKVVQDACRAMLCFPSSLLIAMLVVSLQLSVVIFGGTVTFYLLMIKRQTVQRMELSPNPSKVFSQENGYSSNDKYSKIFGIKPYSSHSTSNTINIDVPSYVYFLLPMYIYCSIWIICFIANFGRMMLQGIFVTWCRISDKKSVSRTVSVRCFATIFRYHLGTIAFASTIFTIIPIIRAVYNSRRDLMIQIRKRPITLYCFWIALCSATENALTTCIARGNSFYRSTQDSLKIVMQNPLKFVATRMVTLWMLIFGLLLIHTLTLGITGLYIYISWQPHSSPANAYVPLIVIGTISYFITGILLYIFSAALESVLLCFLEDSSAKRVNAENYEFPSEDHQV